MCRGQKRHLNTGLEAPGAGSDAEERTGCGGAEEQSVLAEHPPLILNQLLGSRLP